MSNLNLQMLHSSEPKDFRNENEDEYVKMIKADSKKSKAIKMGVGAIYLILLIVSLFVV